MALTTSEIDILILVPLIPLAPIVLTWWLPWERWIPWGRVPKALAGPYLLYVSFVARHFKIGWFVVTISLLWGLAICAWALVEAVMKKRSGPLH
jgi:hypothetical protein